MVELTSRRRPDCPEGVQPPLQADPYYANTGSMTGGL